MKKLLAILGLAAITPAAFGILVSPPGATLQDISTWSFDASFGRYIMGETVMPSAPTPNTGHDVTVDWMVIQGVGPMYTYLYQVEVPDLGSAAGQPAKGPRVFSVTFVTSEPVVASGVYAGDNLDLLTPNHPGHVVAGETEQPQGASLSYSLDPGPLGNANANQVAWTVNNGAFVALVSQSETLWFTSPIPPTLGNGNAADTVPPSPWFIEGGLPVPEPLPAPDSGTTLMLFGSALAGLALLRRKLNI